ncbi:MAG: hypothetical protein Q7U75_09810, partial [Desulfobacterales bacterium]|nr:hypothetical protein [Desulfobacterales bacterium]
LDRMIGINLLQMLWDRGEGGGYVQHLTSNPYEGTDAKTVLLDVAYGDWQVSELSALVAARTIGATIHRPELADGRRFTLKAGMSYQVADGAEPHRSSTRTGATLFIVD